VDIEEIVETGMEPEEIGTVVVCAFAETEEEASDGAVDFDDAEVVGSARELRETRLVHRREVFDGLLVEGEDSGPIGVLGIAKDHLVALCHPRPSAQRARGEGDPGIKTEMPSKKMALTQTYKIMRLSIPGSPSPRCARPGMTTGCSNARAIWKRDSAQHSVIEIVPAGVFLFDQFEFPIAVPAFEAFLAGDGFVDVAVGFEPDETVDTIFLGEAFDQVVLVFPRATQDIVGDADVERSVAFAGEDV